MKKRMLLMSLTLLLIITIGCRNENPNKADNTEEFEEVEYEIGISPYDFNGMYYVEAVTLNFQDK